MSFILTYFELEFLDLFVRLYLLDESTKSAKLFVELLVASLDILDITYSREVVGHKCRNYKCCACSQVRCCNICTGECLPTIENSGVALDSDVCAHS